LRLIAAIFVAAFLFPVSMLRSNSMSQHCDGSRRRRHKDSERTSWYALWRSIRFSRRFGWPPIALFYGGNWLVVER
jgi:hypothetical protein